MCFFKTVCKFLKNECRWNPMKKPYDRPKCRRTVKALVRLTLSESFRIRPRLPFQVNLRFAKTCPWTGFAKSEFSRFSARVVGHLQKFVYTTFTGSLILRVFNLTMYEFISDYGCNVKITVNIWIMYYMEHFEVNLAKMQLSILFHMLFPGDRC